MCCAHFAWHFGWRVIRVSFSLFRIGKVSLPSLDEEFGSSRSVGLPLLDSILGTVVALFYDRGMKLVAFDQIPLTLGHLDDSFPLFHKTSRFRFLDSFFNSRSKKSMI